MGSRALLLFGVCHDWQADSFSPRSELAELRLFRRRLKQAANRLLDTLIPRDVKLVPTRALVRCQQAGVGGSLFNIFEFVESLIERIQLLGSFRWLQTEVRRAIKVADPFS